MIGQAVSHYKIIEKLGSGGMGDVYRAKDLELRRDVAIKVLREELASDPERLRRFEQEARSASALNHPNIITIHEIGKVDSTPYIAMELVEGKTLREMLSEGRIPTKKMLPFAAQIAEGLAKAHAAGIVHRDLKPENIMITGDGFVKILDFGLAKLTGADLPRRSLGEGGSELATIEKGGTSPGVVMGTAGYMSPEQARGEAVDYRADQFALGAILYEMATGTRAFQRDTAVEILSAILKEEPAPLAALNPDIPSQLRVIVERCLAKTPNERYDSTRDLAREIKSIEEPTGVSAETGRRWPIGLTLLGALVVVLAVIIGLNIWGLQERLLGGRDSAQIESIAVLPLDNLSGDPEQEYFSDGMTETLITELSKISALKVISRTSAMRYKDTDKSLPEIARELNVDAIVEGSVLRAGERVRITAQLVHAETDEHIWADNYDRDVQDILALHSEVARAIAQEIRVQLTPQEESLLSSSRPVDPEAHESYLRGVYYFERRSFENAFEYLNHAIETDPRYAPAYATLAGCYGTYAAAGLARPKDVMPKAREAASRALELDENLAEAHAGLGSVMFFYDWDWPAAEREIKRAIELNPGLAGTRYLYGNYLYAMGRESEAVAEHRRALELDPLSLPINWVVASYSLRSAQYDVAIEQLEKILEMEPDFILALASLSEAYYYKGMYEESVSMVKRQFTSRGNTDVVEALENGYEASGFAGAMRAAADELTKQSLKRYVSPSTIARFYTLADEKDGAIQCLERGFEERDPFFVVDLRRGIVHDRLQSDPRFQDIVRRMNFPE